MAFNLNKLKARVIEQGLTLRELAPKVDLSEGSIYDKFAGSCSFKREDIEKICIALQIKPVEIADYFFDM